MEEHHKEVERGKLSIKKKRIMVCFIEATENLLKRDGFEALSIRRIATEAGYNSATLYNYFVDLDHLVLFGSVRHLRDYVMALRAVISPDMNSLEVYRIIYREFGKFSFRSPEIFYNMFFGRYSGCLREVLNQYYELFPDELGEQKSFVRTMLGLDNIYERDLAVMDALVKEGFVKEEKKEVTLRMIVRTHQSFLADACILNDDMDEDRMLTEFMEIFNYIMEAAR